MQFSRFLGAGTVHNQRSDLMEQDLEKNELVELTAEIVSAYVSNNTVVATELPSVIHNVFDALSRASAASGQPGREELKPAVPVKRSVNPDFIICLEDGKKFKSLKRHLRTHYDLSPEEYREKWGLPHDYPMVAPNYAAARSDLAKRMGLGQRRR
jgi:predicted transcriptional regulator